MNSSSAFNTGANAWLARQQSTLLQALLARPGPDLSRSRDALLALARSGALTPPQARPSLSTGRARDTGAVNGAGASKNEADDAASDAAGLSRGLAAYRANAHATAERALRAAYPVLAALIGPDNFAPLARDFWHRHPPVSGDLAQWGAALAGFVKASAALADTPYLGDVARAEWALHRATSAPDALPDLGSLRRLLDEDPAGLALTLSPGTTLLHSAYPVASLWTAHQSPQPCLDAAARRLRAGVGEAVLVWRDRLRPRLRGAEAAEAALLQALLAGHDLPQALALACATPPAPPPAGKTDRAEAATAATPTTVIEPAFETSTETVAATATEAAAGSITPPGPTAFDFATWLQGAVTDGLVTGVHRPPDACTPGTPETTA